MKYYRATLANGQEEIISLNGYETSKSDMARLKAKAEALYGSTIVEAEAIAYQGDFQDFLMGEAENAQFLIERINSVNCPFDPSNLADIERVAKLEELKDRLIERAVRLHALID